MKYLVCIVSTFLTFSAIANEFVCSEHEGKTYKVALLEIDDGDTALFKTPHGNVSVRYWGVDTPESEWPGRWPAQEHSAEAKAYNTTELNRGNLTVTFTGEKTWSRCVGEVFVNSVSLSLGLIENGHGWWNKRYAPDYTELEVAESKAREERLGLWSVENPEAPWDFRRRHPRN